VRNLFNKVSEFFNNDPNAVDSRGFTRLHDAIIDGDLKKVQALIKAGADVDKPFTYNASTYLPLHSALLWGQQMIALALISAGAKINLPDDNGQTPLHIAVAKGQEALVLTLLKFGADPNIKDKYGRTPLHRISRSSPQIIDILAKYHARVNERDENGDTPLHLFLDKMEMAEKLLGHGADPNVLNNGNVSPYMMMLDENLLHSYPKTLQAMIAMKANIESVNPLGETILHIAARLELEETFLHVVDRAELSMVDSNGNTVLHALVRTQNIRMLTRVLERAPDLVHETNRAGSAPLEELVKCAENPRCQFGGKFIAAARLLLAHKANPDSADTNGRGLLYYAVTHDKIEFLDELLALGANPDLADRDGKTALHNAIERHNLQALDMLLDRGANPDMTDQRGWTILDRLAEKGDRDSPIVQRLIVAGGQYQKQLPLHPELIRNQKLIDKNRKKPTGCGDPPPRP